MEIISLLLGVMILVIFFVISYFLFFVSEERITGKVISLKLGTEKQYVPMEETEDPANPSAGGVYLQYVSLPLFVIKIKTESGGSFDFYITKEILKEKDQDILGKVVTILYKKSLFGEEVKELIYSL